MPTTNIKKGKEASDGRAADYLEPGEMELKTMSRYT